MDFPASLPKPVTSTDNLLLGLGIKTIEVLSVFDYFIELEGESAVAALLPDLALWRPLNLEVWWSLHQSKTLILLVAVFFQKSMWMKIR